jgi:hypothetical protein
MNLESAFFRRKSPVCSYQYLILVKYFVLLFRSWTLLAPGSMTRQQNCKYHISVEKNNDLYFHVIFIHKDGHRDCWGRMRAEYRACIPMAVQGGGPDRPLRGCGGRPGRPCDPGAFYRKDSIRYLTLVKKIS